MFWDTNLDIRVSEHTHTTCQIVWCHSLEEHNVTMLPPRTIQNIHKVLMVSVLYGCCYVYIALILIHHMMGQVSMLCFLYQLLSCCV